MSNLPTSTTPKVPTQPIHDKEKLGSEKKERQAGFKVASAIAAFAIGVLAVSQPAFAVNTATANISVNIAAPINISKTADLNLGQAYAGATAGDVILTAAGVRSSAGGTTLGSATGVSAAAFTVTGTPNATYAIAQPADPMISDGSGHSMICHFTGMLSKTTGTLTGGTDSFSLGADLNVKDNTLTPPGSYTGNVSLTVNYN